MRRMRGRDWIAAVQPRREHHPTEIWALPKGNIDAGEKPEETALREVAEETGLRARPVGKLGDIKYVYTWDGERIFKVVSFYLLAYASGRLGDIPPEHAHEVADTRWLPLADAPSVLAYGGEREMARKAIEALSS